VRTRRRIDAAVLKESSNVHGRSERSVPWGSWTALIGQFDNDGVPPFVVMTFMLLYLSIGDTKGLCQSLTFLREASKSCCTDRRQSNLTFNLRFIELRRADWPFGPNPAGF